MSKEKTQIEEAREQKEMNTQEKAQEETKSTQNLADQPEDISVPGEIKDKGNNWMEELKQQINDGIDSISGKKKTAASEEGAPDQAEAAETALNKDLLQKELADSKAGLTHTPMTMTPDLEKLLDRKPKFP